MRYHKTGFDSRPPREKCGQSFIRIRIHEAIRAPFADAS